MTPSAIASYNVTVQPPLRPIVERLTELLDAGLPGAEGTVWHGHPVWKAGAAPVAGFKAFTAWVTLLLWQGQRIDDPSGTLTPSGAGQMASIKIASLAEIDEAAINAWLGQVTALS
jgi:hypothetical protein